MDHGILTANEKGGQNNGKTQYELVRDQRVAELALAFKLVQHAAQEL
jgi:hypothetical protein